jgi:hypothetical protein
MALFSIALFEMLLQSFPSVIILMLVGFSVRKNEEIVNDYQLLGTKIGNVIKNKNYRLIKVIPIYVVYITYSVFATFILNKYIFLNILIIIIAISIIIYFEYKITIATEKWGVYKKGTILYSKIPEIEIVSKRKIEILNKLGSRETILIDEELVNYIKINILQNKNKIINENWNK